MPERGLDNIIYARESILFWNIDDLIAIIILSVESLGYYLTAPEEAQQLWIDISGVLDMTMLWLYTPAIVERRVERLIWMCATPLGTAFSSQSGTQWAQWETEWSARLRLSLAVHFCAGPVGSGAKLEPPRVPTFHMLLECSKRGALSAFPFLPLWLRLYWSQADFLLRKSTFTQWIHPLVR